MFTDEWEMACGMAIQAEQTRKLAASQKIKSLPTTLSKRPGKGRAYQNLGGIGAVDRNAIDNKVQDLGHEDIRAWDLMVMSVPDISLDHSHAVHGQRACLIRADGCGIAHRLTSIQVPYQIVVFHHFLERKEKGLEGTN